MILAHPALTPAATWEFLPEEVIATLTRNNADGRFPGLTPWSGGH